MSSPLLDRVQSLAAIDALDPAAYASELVVGPATTLAELEARDAQLAGALRDIDDFTTRVMRIRLEHALATDSALPVPTRKVFAATITSYANDLALLAERVRRIAGAAVADLVVEAARASLALREALRAPLLARIRDLATAAIADADARARDRDLDDAQRKRWSAARRDLEALAEEPARILAAPFAARVAAWPEQLDEPAPKPEPTLAELIEID